MSIRTPRNVARGFGSAKEGVHHFWIQRLTAVALVPLTLWFLVLLVRVVGADYYTAADILSEPHNAVFMLLFIWAGIYHFQLGLQVVIEDYVEDGGLKTVAQLLNVFFSVMLGVTCAYAALKISFGA